MCRTFSTQLSHLLVSSHTKFDRIWYFVQKLGTKMLKNSIKWLFNENFNERAPRTNFLKWTFFFQQSKRIDFDICILAEVVSVSVFNLFIYCYLGRVATESFLKMSECSYESNWQRLPVKLQKYFIVMIANMQQPLYYHGFSVAVLNLETFNKVRLTWRKNLAHMQPTNLIETHISLVFLTFFQQLMKTMFTFYMTFKTVTSQKD